MYGNGAFLINNATNLRMIQNFAFGFDTGLELTGIITNLLSYGTGIDASRNAIILKNSGNNNTFINSELVCVDNYIWATDKYSGTSDFVNTNNWMSNTGDMTLEELELLGYNFIINDRSSILKQYYYGRTNFVVLPKVV